MGPTSQCSPISGKLYPFGLELCRNFSSLALIAGGETSHWTKLHSRWLFRRMNTPTPGIEPSTLSIHRASKEMIPLYHLANVRVLGSRASYMLLDTSVRCIRFQFQCIKTVRLRCGVLKTTSVLEIHFTGLHEVCG
jgi:hypothetical protein